MNKQEPIIKARKVQAYIDRKTGEKKPVPDAEPITKVKQFLERDWREIKELKLPDSMMWEVVEEPEKKTPEKKTNTKK